MTHSLRAVLASALVFASLAGCESIAGIEDRYLEASDAGPEAAPKPEASQACKDYCDEALENCTGTNSLFFGASPAVQRNVCLATCALMDEGDELEPAGNTVACRTREARSAGMGEPDFYCPRASPGGNGECGSDCESYCKLFEKACPDDAVEGCEAKCRALRDENSYDANRHHDDDSLQCRLVHTSSAAIDPEGHCWHATINPGPMSPCGDTENVEPRCEDYCKVVNTACTGDLAVYESPEQCMAVCEALEPGFGGQTVEDTVACRKYHAYSSLVIDATVHCKHSGPGGDGHCGISNCPPYCRLLKAACPAEFDGAFDSEEACQEACNDIEGAEAESGYNLEDAETGDTVQCRLLHVSRALLDDAECASAMGEDSCQ